jgi:hypothetical protein
MELALQLLGVVATLALGTTLTGRLLCAVWGVTWLRRLTPENFAAAALLGTGTWILLFSACTYLGLTAPWAACVLACFLALLLTLLAVRRRWDWLRPPPPSWATLGLGAACGLAVFVAFLPLLVGNCVSLMHDAFTYICISEWLQAHGFGTPCAQDPTQTAFIQVWFYQTSWWRIGAIFFLALTQALFPVLRAGELYQAVIAWGVVLNVCGVYLLGRWCLRLSRPFATTAAVVLAGTANPLYSGALNGYLPQTYGLAFLALILVLLARLRAGVCWGAGTASLLGLASAALISVYNEMAPLLAVLALAYLVHGLWQTRHRPTRQRFWRFSGIALCSFLLLSNYECYRTVRALPLRLQCTDGRPVPWPTAEFWAFAQGVKPEYVRMDAVGITPLCILTTIGFLVGLKQLAGRRQALWMALVLGVLGVLAAYYHFLVRDPWGAPAGHSWNQFKLSQWAFPLVLVVQYAGWQSLLRPGWLRRLALPLLCLSGFPYAACAHYEKAVIDTTAVQRLTDSVRPFKAWRSLRRRVEALHPKNIYYVPPGELWPGTFLSYVLYPRHFVNDFNCPGHMDAGAMTGPGPTGETLCLRWGELPFEEPRERLPGGLCVLGADRPVIIGFENPNMAAVRSPEGMYHSWIGSARAKLSIWSPRVGLARLTFPTFPGPSKPESPCRVLRVSQADGTTEDFKLEGATTAAIPVLLPAGVSHLEMCCPDTPSKTYYWAPDVPYQMLIMLSQPRLEYVSR